MMIADIAAQERRNVVTVDITGAYLYADMSKSEIHMQLDKCHAEILCVPKSILQDYGSKECSGRLCNAL